MGHTSLFGARLKTARETRELSQTQLARMCGFEPSAIGHFEKGRRLPSYGSIRSLASALGVTSDYLLGLARSMREYRPALEGVHTLSHSELMMVQSIIYAFGKTNPTKGQ